jgi:hypothetical protein
MPKAMLTSMIAAAFTAYMLLAANGDTKSLTSFPQLISTQYETGTPLPADAQRPAPAFDFVDRSLLPTGAAVLSAAKAASGAVCVVTDRGSFRIADGKAAPLQMTKRFKPLQPPTNPDAVVTCVVNDGDGHVWIASTMGVFITDGDQWWQPVDRRDGMPYEDMTCLHLAANGDVWGGTTQGAWRLRNGLFRYFWGKRWLPGNRVRAIWTDARGRAWIETDGGTACIEDRPMTLADKAAHFDLVTQERHNRRGWIFETHLKVRGKPEQGWFFEASDNDGSWTSPYLAAMSFRYAATKDPVALKQAQQCANAMMELERLSGVKGYPARAVATDEEIQQGIRGIDFKETVRMPGETDKIWYRSPVDPKVWCKDDCSSDEIDNHFFSLYVYHDLAADATEKARVAAYLKRVMDHIIEGNYTLIGHTGRRTLWGFWSPALLNDWENGWEQRPLNSLEILAYLKVTAHVTGEAAYERRYEDLIQQNHYLLNTLLFRRDRFALWERINHSDDALAYVSYYPLLMLEKDAARRGLLAQSLAGTWETTMEPNVIPRRRLAFFNFAYGATTGNKCSVDDAVATLQEWPWDMVFWNTRNSHRSDVTARAALGVHEQAEITRALSPAERHQQRWNGDPYEPDGGHDGMMEDDGGAWLVSYWMGVYHGYIPRE